MRGCAGSRGAAGMPRVHGGGVGGGRDVRGKDEVSGGGCGNSCCCFYR